MIKNKVVKNASWIIACNIVQSLLGLAVSMLTARYLGPLGYGVISYAASVVAFVVPVMQLGLSNILVRETLQYPEQEGTVFGTAIIMSLISAAASAVGVVSFSFVANAGDPQAVIVCALYSTLLFCQALNMIQYWFQAKYLSKYTAIVSVCAYFTVSLYKIFLLVCQMDILWFAISNALDIFIIATVLLIIYKRLGGQKLRFSSEVAKRMFASSRHYIVSNLMITAFVQIDKIMITLIMNETATGWYTAAFACAGITNFVFVAIVDSASPMIYESREKDMESFRLNVTRLYSVITYVALAQSVAMTLLAEPIIGLLYGDAYAPAVGALQIIVWCTVFSYFGAVRSVWILAEKKQKYLWIINLSGALSNVVLNAFMIPLAGIYGAAAASLITQFFANVAIGFIIKPIRENNRLLINGLNPKHIIGLIKSIK